MSVTAIDGFDVEPKVGSYVKPDGWPIGELLLKGDSFSTFRIPVHCPPIESLAVEIEVTARTIRWRDNMVRVKITFPGDGEPDTVTRGWMKV